MEEFENAQSGMEEFENSQSGMQPTNEEKAQPTDVRIIGGIFKEFAEIHASLKKIFEQLEVVKKKQDEHEVISVKMARDFRSYCDEQRRNDEKRDEQIAQVVEIKRNEVKEAKIARLCQITENLSSNIVNSIKGTWKIIHRNNCDKYLKQIEKNSPEELRMEQMFMRSLYCAFNKGTLECWTLVNEKLRKELFSETLNVEEDGSVLTLEGNCLRTSFTDDTGRVFKTIDRYISDGKLHFVYQRFLVSCEVVYERIR